MISLAEQRPANPRWMDDAVFVAQPNRPTILKKTGQADLEHAMNIVAKYTMRANWQAGSASASSAARIPGVTKARGGLHARFHDEVAAG